jgi:hypothetical protein
MKLFAQHGAQAGEKVTEGLSQGLLDGVVFSPRDIGIDALRSKLTEIAENWPSAERLFDPQYYAVFLADNQEARLGNLVDDYSVYLQQRRRGQLEREANVRKDVRATLEFQQPLGVTAFIAPGILIPRSLNSVETVIAKNFIRAAAEEHAELNDPRKVFATLAVSREALVDKQELIEFVNEITALEMPPHGFYLLVAARNTDARSDIYHADVIAGWMFLNHVLKLNGFEVINGYSDILTPFLGAAGGAAGCLGWWSNLRAFSMARFSPSEGGGRLPIQRYLSVGLLNRITYFELNAVRSLRLPGILNGLPLDELYPADDGSSPERAKEVLQSWEAVRELNRQLVPSDSNESLRRCAKAVTKAGQIYDIIPLPLDGKSNREHLESLREGMQLYARLAEINPPAD